ncbi:MAG: 1-(5-phosphoribosyl)-5-[Clostridia bacterium]|nr:1-(5-phosphoribosyl)-5-[(5-phosphoribosylamino)methylideneamino]imidazole-4-carboxamide isomerase [Clostridia bacterium]
MILLPAIDIYEGNAVRLLGGDYGKVTIYGNPLDMAKRFEDAGAEWIHVVDLNGAESSGNNFDIIEKISSRTSLKVESGGGLRDESKVKALLDAGAKRAVLGTICATATEKVGEMIEKFGAEAIVCGLDVKDGKIAVRGWKEKSELTALQLGKTLADMGAKYFLHTDVSRDGMLSGANIDGTAILTEKLNACVIASGGVKDINDIKRIKERGIYAAILGKAYYENKVDLKEALKLCAN